MALKTTNSPFYTLCCLKELKYKELFFQPQGTKLMERAIKLTLNPKHECKMLSFVDFKTQHWFYDEFIYSISCNTGKKMNKLNTIKLGKHTFHQWYAHFFFTNQIFVKMPHTSELFYCI